MATPKKSREAIAQALRDATPKELCDAFEARKEHQNLKGGEAENFRKLMRILRDWKTKQYFTAEIDGDGDVHVAAVNLAPQDLVDACVIVISTIANEHPAMVLNAIKEAIQEIIQGQANDAIKH